MEGWELNPCTIATSGSRIAQSHWRILHKRKKGYAKGGDLNPRSLLSCALIVKHQTSALDVLFHWHIFAI